MFLFFYYYMFYSKALLVAGGYDFDILSSTEVLPATSSSWVLANPLPRMITSMKGVTLGGVLYMTG